MCFLLDIQGQYLGMTKMQVDLLIENTIAQSPQHVGPELFVSQGALDVLLFTSMSLTMGIRQFMTI